MNEFLLECNIEILADAKLKDCFEFVFDLLLVE